MHRTRRPESRTHGGAWNGVEYVVVAVLHDIGFACVSEIEIDGFDLMTYPPTISRLNTLEQAIEGGNAFARAWIEAHSG